MLFDNAQACMSWLNYLQKQCGAESLLGKDLQSVAQQVWLYNCAGDMLNFYSEIPLLGTSTMDISCQYLASHFAKYNAFRQHELEKQGARFYDYCQKLNSILPDEYREKCMFLEADTSTDRNKQLSVFYQLQNAYVDELLPFLLEQEHYPNMLNQVEAVIKLLYPDAELWQLGFMQGREQKPLRLVMHVNNNGLQGCLTKLKIADYQSIVKLIEDLTSSDFFVIDILDLDLYPEIGLGPTIGVELAIKKLYPTVQQQIVQSKAYVNFKELLIKSELADERIHSLEKCIFAGIAPDKYQMPYYMYSGISHFKLQWQDGCALPAKAYLRMRTDNLKVLR